MFASITTVRLFKPPNLPLWGARGQSPRRVLGQITASNRNNLLSAVRVGSHPRRCRSARIIARILSGKSESIMVPNHSFCDCTTFWRGTALPSMSRPANPYDNATSESFLKTLKREEIYASTYRDFEDLQERLEDFIERYYNEFRLHSALGYCSPEKFEKDSQVESERTSAA